MALGASFFEDVPSVEFMYLVFTRMPGGVTAGDSDLYCCVPCLLSAITFACSFDSLKLSLHFQKYLCVIRPT